MDEDDLKEENPQPSASKKESERAISDHDLYEERGDDPVSRSESSASTTYSVRSRLDIADANLEIPKPSIGKHREKKQPERKKRGKRATGRVNKRKRSSFRRQVVRRVVKRRPRIKENKNEREPSITSAFTRLSSVGSQNLGCKYCGHCTCRRRSKEDSSRRKTTSKNVRQKKYPTKTSGRSIPRLEGTQAGSVSKILSPLFVNTSSLPKPDETAEDEAGYCEITPEIIHSSLKRLTKWRQNVITSSIMNDIKKYYPVNPELDSLETELHEKLRVAAIVGIVTRISENYWCLNCALQNRQLTPSHVSMFWQVYGDTMQPVTKKNLDEEQNKLLEDETNTNARKLFSFTRN